jgi:peptidoglycan/LPS O-acetylase OafA/YrhL
MLSLWRSLPERLSRVTSGGKIISEIDGFRFLAIFPVVVNHLAQRIERYATHPFDPPLNEDPYFFWASRGYVGVYVFFVISGFILSMPFASHFIHQTKPVKLKDYFVRRLTRLEPPYIIVITLCFVGGVLTHLGTFAELLPHYGASLLYLHTIIYKIWTPLNPVAWTLEVEVQFYILAPFLAILFFRIPDKMLRRIVIGGVIIAIVCVQQYYGWMKYPWRFYLLGHLHFFLTGFLLADMYLCDWKDGRKPGVHFDIISLLCIVGIFVVISHDFANRLAYPVILFFLFYGAFRSRHIITFFRNRWIAAIGGMCYTIYLIHLPLSEAFERVFNKFPVTNSFIVNLLVQLPVFLLLTFAVSVVFFLAIEKPCMNKDWPRQLKEKIMQRYRPLKS